MHDRSEPRPATADPPHQDAKRHDHGGIGFALFLVLAGLVLLAERLGWVPVNFDWLFPIILVAWGAGELYLRLGTR
jgi:hypothetical protein